MRAARTPSGGDHAANTKHCQQLGLGYNMIEKLLKLLP
jgi:hypothetical protein